MAETITNRLKKLENQLEIANIQADYYKESYQDATQAMLALDNVGWNLLGGITQASFSLDDLKRISVQLSEWTDSNPLLFNGWDKRCSYLFGSGYSIQTGGTSDKISARAQSLVDNVVNQQNVFSQDAMRTNERSRYTNGIIMLMFNKERGTFTRLPLSQVDDAVTDPDNLESVWYYRRTYSRKVANLRTGEFKQEDIKVWYRTDQAVANGAPVMNIINGDKVDPNIIVVDDIVGRHEGNTWGVPDAFAASPWALAYSAYLRDGTKVLASLADWAWKLSPKTKDGGDRAGAKIKTSTGEAGKTVVTDMDMQALPRANAVDLGTGRPIAAQAAAALGLSVVILISDPGQSGAFATANTLTDPSIRSMLARQEVNGRFYERCLSLLGVVRPKIVWEKMSPDADYREQQTLIAALGTGAFWVDEIREPLAKVANITIKHDGPPPGFMYPNNAKSLPRKDIDTDSSGTVDDDGTTPLTNGQGKANTAKPSYGVNDLRATGGRE